MLTLEHDGSPEIYVNLMKAAARILEVDISTDDFLLSPTDALWPRPDRGFYAVSLVDCRRDPAIHHETWIADQTRGIMLDVHLWEERHSPIPGSPELILILLLHDQRDLAITGSRFKEKTKSMKKPSKCHFWLTREAQACVADPQSPRDLFELCDM